MAVKHRYASGALKIIGSRAWSYATIIRDVTPEGVAIDNVTKYSRTTSKHLSEVRNVLGPAYIQVDEVSYGAETLVGL